MKRMSRIVRTLHNVIVFRGWLRMDFWELGEEQLEIGKI
jgi:hypothetical protein